MAADPGKLVILSGPSGAGKSTLVRELLARCRLPLRLSVSATTRPPRPGEVDGRDYRFLTGDQFEALRRADAFIECKEVFGRGHWYGTPREPVDRGLAAGEWVILEIDVEGAAAVLDKRPDVITIFVHPGSREELERRLRTRGTEDEGALRRRLEVAEREMRFLPAYRHTVINDTKERAVGEIERILESYARSPTALPTPTPIENWEGKREDA